MKQLFRFFFSSSMKAAWLDLLGIKPKSKVRLASSIAVFFTLLFCWQFIPFLATNFLPCLLIFHCAWAIAKQFTPHQDTKLALCLSFVAFAYISAQEFHRYHAQVKRDRNNVGNFYKSRAYAYQQLGILNPPLNRAETAKLGMDEQLPYEARDKLLRHYASEFGAETKIPFAVDSRDFNFHNLTHRGYRKSLIENLDRFDFSRTDPLRVRLFVVQNWRKDPSGFGIERELVTALGEAQFSESMMAEMAASDCPAEFHFARTRQGRQPSSLVAKIIENREKTNPELARETIYRPIGSDLYQGPNLFDVMRVLFSADKRVAQNLLPLDKYQYRSFDGRCSTAEKSIGRAIRHLAY